MLDSSPSVDESSPWYPCTAIRFWLRGVNRFGFTLNMFPGDAGTGVF